MGVAVHADFCTSSTSRLRSNAESQRKCTMKTQSIWERQKAARKKKRKRTATDVEANMRLRMSQCNHDVGIRKGQTRLNTQVQTNLGRKKEGGMKTVSRGQGCSHRLVISVW